MEKTYICTCCVPAKAYANKRGLRKHESEYSPSYVYGGINVEKEKAYTNQPKKCRSCDEYLSYQQFKNGNRYCGSSCAARVNNNRSGTGILTEFEVKHGSYPDVKERKQLRKKDLLEIWVTDPSIASNANGDLKRIFKEHILFLSNYKCSECGWDKVNKETGRSPLQVDHMDGDWSNNSMANLKVLCPNCHSLTATYGSLNRGRGRRSTRQKQ